MKKIIFTLIIVFSLFIVLEAGAQKEKVKKEKEKSLRSRISEMREKNSVKKEDFFFPFLNESRLLSSMAEPRRTNHENRNLRVTVEEFAFDFSDFNSENYDRGYTLKSTSENGVLIEGVEEGAIWHLFVKVEGFEDNFATTPSNRRKPSTDLQVRKMNTGAFFPVLSDPSGYGTEVARGRGTGLPIRFGLDYRMILNWAKDNPGKYKINLVYNVVIDSPSSNSDLVR